MSTVQEKLTRLRAFFGDVAVEMRKTTWPERKELVESTFVVIVAILLVGFFLTVSDRVVVTLLKYIIPYAGSPGNPD